jgi:DNA mismatch endonuclease (patch repair protein)
MSIKAYSRDKRSPLPKNELVSKVMRANKAKGTMPELIFRKVLYDNGYRGYRINYKKVPGTPDIAFIAKKIAIFINGCYWHRCPTCNLQIPKSNIDFWEDKFKLNVQRDIVKKEALFKMGWRVIYIWECQLKKERIKNVLNTLENIF